MNSHATSAWFSVNVADPDVFEQPANGNRMGYEAEDPWSFACGAYDCRYSDAARIAHGPQSVVPIEFGEIALTTEPPRLINNDPRFHIVSESTQLVGMDVDKVGFNTGWTFGTLEDDCADLSPGPGILLLCQSIADYDFGAGDSGASVFVWNGTSDVSLLGLHWGGSGDGTKAFFSSVENLHWDFGPFATY